jgi:membrane protein YqaA with SNARE-associated domain
MWEWLQATFTWVQKFIIGVPIYFAGPTMILVGALDSSLLSLPEINDYLVIMRCYGDPKSVFYFPLFASAGSVLGCTILYSIVRKGGQALFRRKFKAEHIARVERAYARFGFLAIAVPAMLPPPMPFKIFVATAGALEYPRRRFMLTVMIARSLRYFIEGTLAVFYGEAVLRFLHANAPYIISVVATVCLIGLVVYAITGRIRSRRDLAPAAAPDEPTAEEGAEPAQIEGTREQI